MEEIVRQLIERYIPMVIDVATVKKIKGDVVHVESLTTEKDFFNCRINAIEVTKTNKLKITPKEGSTVVIGIFKDTEKAVLLKLSEVEKIELQIDSTKCEVDSNGYKVERDGENLKTVLNDYIDEVNKIVVLNGTSINVGATTLIKERLNKILIA